jgi:hypothetical protein
MNSRRRISAPKDLSADIPDRRYQEPTLTARLGIVGNEARFIGRERADATGGIHAGTSCSEVSRQPSEGCDGIRPRHCVRGRQAGSAPRRREEGRIGRLGCGLRAQGRHADSKDTGEDRETDHQLPSVWRFHISHNPAPPPDGKGRSRSQRSHLVMPLSCEASEMIVACTRPGRLEGRALLGSQVVRIASGSRNAFTHIFLP